MRRCWTLFATVQEAALRATSGGSQKSGRAGPRFAYVERDRGRPASDGVSGTRDAGRRDASAARHCRAGGRKPNWRARNHKPPNGRGVETSLAAVDCNVDRLRAKATGWIRSTKSGRRIRSLHVRKRNRRCKQAAPMLQTMAGELNQPCRPCNPNLEVCREFQAQPKA